MEKRKAKERKAETKRRRMVEKEGKRQGHVGRKGRSDITPKTCETFQNRSPQGLKVFVRLFLRFVLVLQGFDWLLPGFRKTAKGVEGRIN